jgi:hypothetical protein
MDRKEFLNQSIKYGLCACAIPFYAVEENMENTLSLSNDEVEAIKREKEFIQNWLSDLLESMNKVLDRETMVKVIEGCGRGCYNRHKFKQDIAEQGKGDLDNLLKAYEKNFEIWKEDNTVHIRYGKVSKGCYCPAAKYRPPVQNDIHCECTRTTHQTIFETALGKPFKVDILETVRRGGVTCHFAVHLD